jgi:hypothetical protein
MKRVRDTVAQRHSLAPFLGVRYCPQRCLAHVPDKLVAEINCRAEINCPLLSTA